MDSVGVDLKSEREKKHLSLEQIAANTRIGLRHLQSLEEGRYGDLPGGMYNRAFLRAYCEILGIDQQAILQRYEAEIANPLEKPAKSKVHMPQFSSFFKAGPTIAWGLMLLFSATGLFFSRKWIAAVFSPYFSHPPAASARYAPAAELDVSAAQTPSAPVLPPATVQQDPSKGAPIQDHRGAAPFSSRSQTPSLRLEFVVLEKCWISIDSDGGKVLRRVLEPGEEQSFNASESFYIILGNAGGVHLKINGKPAKPLGKQGEVVKMLINERTIQDLIDHSTG